MFRIAVSQSPPWRTLTVMLSSETITDTAVEAQFRRDRVDPFACTEGGIARPQHQGAEAQQNFQCVGRWDGALHIVPFES